MFCGKAYKSERWLQKHYNEVHSRQMKAFEASKQVEEALEQDIDLMDTALVLDASHAKAGDHTAVLDAMPTSFAQFGTTRLIVPDDHEDEDSDDSDIEIADPDAPETISAAVPNRLEEFSPPAQVIGETPPERMPIRIDLPLWQPFNSAHEFKLARWIVSNRLTTKAINEMFNEGIVCPPVDESGTQSDMSFTSAYSLFKIFDDMDPEMAPHRWFKGVSRFSVDGSIDFQFRSLEAMIRHLFIQPMFEDCMVYMPKREFVGDSNVRVLSEMHTAYWWWREQVPYQAPLKASQTDLA